MQPEYFYHPTDIDDEMFLSEVPIDLMIKSIKAQFNEPLEYRKNDYIQSFITKYEYSLEQAIDEEDRAMVEEYHDQFIGFMMNIFDEYLDISFVDMTTVGAEDQNDLIHFTYRYFIKDIKKNFVNLVYNYINDYKEDIEKNVEQRKDVTSLQFREEIDDEYVILVISNLSTIIDQALDFVKYNVTPETFFDMTEGEHYEVDLGFVKKEYDKCQIVGNFIEKYIDFIDDDFKIEIQSQLRNKLLKKYTDRQANIVDSDDT